MATDVPGRARVLIVAEHASMRFGGEAVLPLQYFRYLRKRGVECWLLVHARTRDELGATLGPEEMARVRFVEDLRAQRFISRAGDRLPDRVKMFTTGWAVHLLTQWQQRHAARRLVREHGITVVHEPIPVSPKLPSMLHGVGAPVIIGPMNGGMSFPPGFPHLDRKRSGALFRLARRAGGVMNRVIPGKRRATLLLVANERTRRALPKGLCPNVVEFVENGVDLGLWRPGPGGRPAGGEPVFVYVGRLVALKACDLMLRAFARVNEGTPARLVIVGDGPERAGLESLARELNVGDRVAFRGWMPQAACAAELARADAMVLPSLHECGGAVVLEAMAAGLPVIASDWGGPADYLDGSCGVLVKPENPEQFVSGLAEAMGRLASSPELRARLGAAGRSKVEALYCWERKIDRMLKIYSAVAATGDGRRRVRLAVPAGVAEPRLGAGAPAHAGAVPA
jgi:glycosyltransferase involved in cell wall biosynthesis